MNQPFLFRYIYSRRNLSGRTSWRGWASVDLEKTKMI